MARSRKLAAWSMMLVGFFGWIAPSPTPAFQASATSPRRPFQDLWIPPTMEGTSFDLTLSPSSQSFWNGATTRTYGYNGAGFWGPTLILEQGSTVQMKVKNAIDEPTTVHWHGLHLPASTDGGPHQMIEPGATWSPSFRVMNQAGTYWYHPHPHETTQKQLTYGAGGLILIRDPIEAKLALPRNYGVDDIPLVLTSRRFYTNDQFSFEGDNDKYGDYLLVNGTLDARVKLPSQFVRLRILNAEIERGYILGFKDNRTFHVIATDGGLIDAPLPVQRVRLMVGERVEILVDLGGEKPGSGLDLMAYHSNQPFGFPGGEPGTTRPNGSLLNNIDFRVLRINVADPTPNPITTLPRTLTKNRYWTDADVTNRRTIKITAGQPGSTFSFDNVSYTTHAKSQVVELGAVEEWTIVNNNVFGHSFHIHDVQFNIVKRSRGAVADFERGWKDSVYVPRGQSVSFIARFDDFASETDPFMYHCHMANHEDGGLMGQFVVKDPKASGKSTAQAIEFRPRQDHPVSADKAREATRRVGTIAPDFQEKDLDGRPIVLASLAREKPVVLFFIEPRCPCSKDASPYFDRLRAEYGDACTIVGVIDADPELARTWTKQVDVHFPIIADPDQKLIRTYAAEGSTFTTLIQPGGTIAKTYPGYGSAMLSDLADSIARLGGVESRIIDLAGAPATLVSGCPFPTR